MIAARVNFSCPSRWCALARCADAHPDRVDELLDELARVTGRVDGQVRADEFDHVGAGERGLVDARRRRAMRARSWAARARARRALGARRVMRVAVQAQAARVGAPLLFEFLPRQRLRFGWAGGFLRRRQLRGGGFPVDHDQIVARPFAQPGGAPRPRRDGFLVTPASSAIPECGSTGSHSKPRSTCSSWRRVA